MKNSIKIRSSIGQIDRLDEDLGDKKFVFIS